MLALLIGTTLLSTTAEAKQISIAECKLIGKKINLDIFIDEMMDNMTKYAENDCDSRIGEPTRKERLKEIQDIKKELRK